MSTDVPTAASYLMESLPSPAAATPEAAETKLDNSVAPKLLSEQADVAPESNGPEPTEQETLQEPTTEEALIKAQEPEAPPADTETTTNENEPQETEAQALQRQLGLLPTALVLAKVKGFRPWPAMVLAEEILPSNILLLKPKSIKLARKPTSPVIVIPVRFFSDDTYIWIKSCDLRLLTKEDIDSYLEKKGNAKKQDILTDAYRLAQNPPDMYEFNMWGSRGPPPMDDTLGSEGESGDEPKPKKLKLSIKLKKPKNATKATKTAPKQSRTAKPTRTAKLIEPASLEDSEDEFSESQEGFDSDWGLDELQYDYETGDFVFDDDTEQQRFCLEFPDAALLADALASTTDQLADLEERVTPVLLLGHVPNEKRLVADLREIKRFVLRDEFPIVAFTRSQLFRVLLLTMHKPAERFPYALVRSEIANIFRGVDLEACTVSEADLEEPKEPEQTEEPEEIGEVEEVEVKSETPTAENLEEGSVLDSPKLEGAKLDGQNGTSEHSGPKPELAEQTV